MTTAGEDNPPVLKRLCLRVTAQADPSVLTRLLGHLQHLNLTPRRVAAEWRITAAADTMEVQIEVCGLSEECLTNVVARIGQFVPVLHAYWRHT
jgi:hypothetical protein